MHYSDGKENFVENENQSSIKEGASNKKEDIFAVVEIQIEELAIDGICGVY